MKKKILLIISNMESGGVSKSMSSLLNVIDTDRYDVDCFILNPTGIFMDLIPKNISLIKDKKTSLFFSAFPGNLMSLLKLGAFHLVFLRILAGIFMKINRGWGGYFLSKGISKLNTTYDLAIDYNGQHQLYYLVDRVKAVTKASFFHSDYKKWPYYYSMDKYYYPKVDKIFTISDVCVDSLKKYFPEQASKVEKMENISSSKLIMEQALRPIDDSRFSRSNSLITIGHISDAKGSDIAIQAAKILKDRNLLFKWYFIGGHTNQAHFEKLVKAYALEGYIVFLGLKVNPYPYLLQAEIVVHPSRFEGKSIALDEAKILCKPIVVTNFSTVYDQFENHVNASICEMNALDLANTVEELLTSENLKSFYIKNLQTHTTSNESEINKIYQLLTT